MLKYTLRRILLMVPTFFGISLVLFLVLNLSPGRPGAAQRADGAGDTQSAATQESYRIFREQFALDKPILLNTRFLLSTDAVEDLVLVAAGLTDKSATERVRAQDELEDLGSFAVPHLLALAQQAVSAEQRPLRDASLRLLPLSARLPLVNPFAEDRDPVRLAKNREIDGENALLRELTLDLNTTEPQKVAVLERWQAWYQQRAARFNYSFGEKCRIFFFQTRFATYWSNLLHLDFGVSLVSRESVMTTLLQKLKFSISLSLGSLLLAYCIAIPLGVFSAVKRNTPLDRASTLLLFMLYSLPSFFAATLLLVVFSEGSDWPSLRWFPTGGWQSANTDSLTLLGKLYDVLRHLVLPGLCMTYGLLAALSRYMRGAVLEVIRSDYIRTARAKGLAERVVIGKHALRNSLLPILTLLAGLLPAALGGSVVVEYIFGIPGIGLWMVESIYQRDYNVIMGVQLLSTVLVLIGILLTDLSYALVDPRIRYS